MDRLKGRVKSRNAVASALPVERESPGPAVGNAPELRMCAVSPDDVKRRAAFVAEVLLK